MERIKQAYVQMRRNRRELNKKHGIDQFGMTDTFTPTGDPAIFEGVNATPEELILYHEARFSRATAKSALLMQYALAGLATEMTMHEANSLLGSLRYQAKHFLEEYPEDSTGERMKYAVERLQDDFSFLHRFKASEGFGRSATPKSVMEAIKHEFSRSFGKELIVEASPAFMNADINVDEKVIFAVFINLVRNAYQWASRAGRLPATVRLDSERVEHEVPSWDDETETETTVMGHSDILVISDNGPGLPYGMTEAIFEPGFSGRNSSGIGLHLCKAGLESRAYTIIADETRSEIGGAVFRIGRQRLLKPDAPKIVENEMPREKMLANALWAMRDLVAAGHLAEAADMSGLYEEAAGITMRLRLRGVETSLQEELLEAVDALEETMRSTKPILESRDTSLRP